MTSVEPDTDMESLLGESIPCIVAQHDGCDREVEWIAAGHGCKFHDMHLCNFHLNKFRKAFASLGPSQVITCVGCGRYFHDVHDYLRKVRRI